MTDAELPPSVPRQLHDLQGGSASARELELPGSLGQWVSALMLWPVIDEPAYRLVERCLGDGRGPEWTFLTSLLEHASIAKPGSEPDTFTLHGTWVPVFQRGVDALGGVSSVRS